MTLREIQRILAFFGYLDWMQVDGQDGPITKGAVMAWQSDHQLEVDGIPGYDTQENMKTAILEVQMALCTNGYSVAADSHLGTEGVETLEAFEQFQRDRGLEADRICGVNSKAALNIVQEAPSVDGMASEHFAMSEYACDCGGKYCDGYPAVMNLHLLQLIEQIRQRIGLPITVNSGLRCNERNNEVGGVPGSLHLYGEAADLYCEGLGEDSVDTIGNIAEEMGLTTIRYYPGEGTFTHVQI